MKQITKYLQADININSTNRKFYLVFFSVFTAFVFLNFFEPFGLYYDNTITHEEVFIELFIAMTLAFVVLLLLQFVVRALFKIDKFTILSLFFWFLFEAFCVSLVWVIFEFLDEDFSGDFLTVWFENFTAYTLIMFFPYFLYVSYLYIKDVITKLKNETLAKKSKNKPMQNITLKDENNIIKLILKTDNLLFIQSADNYVEVNFLKEGVVTKTLLRNSVKKLEAMFINTPIIRCHRSYIVNTNKVESATKTSTGFNIELSHISGLTIPVSKSYISEFKKFLL